MANETTVMILIDQRGNSNKIWAQVGRLTFNSKGVGRHPVIHGPIRTNGAGLVKNQSSANWQDKQQKGYQMLVTFEGVPEGMERVCVAAIAHVKAGDSPILFNAGSAEEISFARKCAKTFLTKCNWGGHGLTVDISKIEDDAAVVIESNQGEAPGSARECETCQGSGTIDETQGGEHFSNPKARCPDCDGKGYFFAPKHHLAALLKSTRRSGFF